MTESQCARVQKMLRLCGLDLLKHGEFQRGQRWLGQSPPNIVAEEKKTISVSIGLGDMEVGANEGDHQRIEDVIDQLEEDFFPFLRIRLSYPCRSTILGRNKPLKRAQLSRCQLERHKRGG